MKIKIFNSSPHPLPKYETKESVGMDLRANLGKTKTLILKPFKSVIIPTGVHIALPPVVMDSELTFIHNPTEKYQAMIGYTGGKLNTGEGYGYEAQIRPRSGISAKHELTIINSPGTIDGDYRGEIGIILYNLKDKEYEITDGQKIAQMVIARYERIVWDEVDSVEKLGYTERGSGGFGHTGK